MEVEYMTLLERDREKFQEGIEQGIEQGKIEAAKALLDILDDETIAMKIGLSLEKIKSLRGKESGILKEAFLLQQN